MACESCPAIPALARATGQSEAVVRISLGLTGPVFTCPYCTTKYESQRAMEACCPESD